MYIVDEIKRSILNFDSDGNFITSFGEHGKGQVLRPYGVAVDSDGIIYVTEKIILEYLYLIKKVNF